MEKSHLNDAYPAPLRSNLRGRVMAVLAGMLILAFSSLPAFAARQVFVLNSYHQGYK